MLTKNPVRPLASGVFYCLLVAPVSLVAQSVTPFPTRDQNPLVLIYGLPTAAPAQLVEASRSQLSVSLNISNTINAQNRGDESLFVDAETYQLNLVYDYGIRDDWMFRIQLPFIKHGEGFMDDWIDSYHELFNLPENVRPYYPNDRLNIRYSLNGNDLVSLRQSTNGVGDIALQTAWQASDADGHHLSYWLSLELPTGDSDRLTGSGSTDLALWLAGDRRLAGDTWVYANLGAVFMSDSDVLTEQHENSALFGTIGMQFQPWHPVQLGFQFDMHSAFYDADVEFLGRVIQLTFGGSILLTPRSMLDIAVAEDIQSNASPDVNFNITWRTSF